MAWLEPVTLGGLHARLEPLSQHHRDRARLGTAVVVDA